VVKPHGYGETGGTPPWRMNLTPHPEGLKTQVLANSYALYQVRESGVLKTTGSWLGTVLNAKTSKHHMFGLHVLMPTRGPLLPAHSHSAPP